MNRKLRKLFRNPKAYFRDSRLMMAIRRFFKLRIRTPVRKIGKNWKDMKHKPVALMLGFMPWKRQFVAEYLIQYRTLFSDTVAPIELYSDSILQYKPMCIIIWGYSERYDVTAFSAQHGIPVYRMEDGFLRSSTLGSAHSRPYSLVLDKSSLYFNGEVQSDLEILLATFDFKHSPKLLSKAEKLIEFQREFGISKYNLPADNNNFEIEESQRKRVLVIGQVEDDKSILYGGRADWNSTRLIQLACDENPDCEVLFKPHPDVLLGHRKNNSPLDSLPEQCTVISSNIPVAELFHIVEHVYVNTSLSGFEALLHGKTVTTVGLPFYAGWGLTDDRYPQERRKRKLSLTELYAGAYLLYPQYILNPSDSADGCKKTLFKLCEEKNGIRLLGENWVFTNKPVALTYCIDDRTAQALSKQLPGYRLAKIKSNDIKLGKVCRAMAAKAVIAAEGTLTDDFVQWASRKDIKLFHLRKGIDCSGCAPNGSGGAFICEPVIDGIKSEEHRYDALLKLLGEYPVHEHAEGIATMRSLLPLSQVAAKGYGAIANEGCGLSSLPMKVKNNDTVLILGKNLDEAIEVFALLKQERPEADCFVMLDDDSDLPCKLPDGMRQIELEHLQRALDHIDYLYTKDSIHALEALRRGLPVTVTGEPFYAGWGFTDDRKPLKRPRKISIDEFFYAVYLLYPRYACDIDDSLTGFFAESLREYACKLDAHVRSKKSSLFAIEGRKLKPSAKVTRLQRLLAKQCDAPLWHMTVCCLLWSMAKENEQEILLQSTISKLPPRMYEEFLPLVDSTDNGRTALHLARLHKECNSALALREYMTALTKGRATISLLYEIAQTLALCMDFESSIAVYRLLLELDQGNIVNSLEGLVVGSACMGRLPEALLWQALLSMKDMTAATRAVDATHVFWLRHFPEVNMYACIRNLFGNKGPLAKKVMINLFAQDFDTAIGIMDADIEQVSDSLQLASIYARIRFYCGDYDEADRAYDYIDRRFGLSPSMCYHYMYFCNHAGRLEKLESLLERCGSMTVPNKIFFKKSVRLHHRDINGNMLPLCDLDMHDKFRQMLGTKCVRSLDSVQPGERVLVVACSGLGDEIANAAFYNMITEACPGETSFTCDSRLLSFLSRSFPNLRIHPVRRLRNNADLAGRVENYTNLPSSVFIKLFDNHGFDLYENADKVILDIDAVRDVIHGYDDFTRMSLMKADDKLVRHYRSQLPDDDRLKIGLCWRSAGKRFSRARNYCKIEDFDSLFKRDDTFFVILQYDGCTTHEAAWLAGRHPGKTMFFDGLDMFNDLEGLAAAVASLDMVISTAVNIRQFSGSLDVPTSLLVSGLSMDWRKEENGDRDLLFPRTRHHRIEDVGVLLSELHNDINEEIFDKISG